MSRVSTSDSALGAAEAPVNGTYQATGAAITIRWHEVALQYTIS
jgi:hypothetical protein